jgi:hypothetical protein
MRDAERIFSLPAGQPGASCILVHVFIIYFYCLQTQTIGRHALLCRMEGVGSGLA